MMLRRAILALAIAAGPANAHDFYGNLKSPAGALRCGGDPVTGDCEGTHDYRVSRNGDVRFFSERYHAEVLIPEHQVVPAEVLEDPERRPLHWCGKPNGQGGFNTFCAFLRPPGF